MGNDPDSSDSSESNGWIDVESDGHQNLEISDSEGENLPASKTDKGGVTTPDHANDGSLSLPQASADRVTPRVSTLATTKVWAIFHDESVLCLLSPLLNDLRLKAATDAVQARGGSHTKRKLAALEVTKKAMSGTMSDSFTSENDIIGPS